MLHRIETLNSTNMLANVVDATNTKRLAFLDYLRIFAFVSVLIGHKFYALLSAQSENPLLHATPKLLLRLLLPIFWNGGAGVIVFFIISGYIITHVLSKETATLFLFKRIFRIYPLYIVAMLSQLAVDYFVFHQPIPAVKIILGQMLLVGDFFHAPYTLSGVEWTLRIEIVFYAFMALLKWAGFINIYRATLPFVLIGAAFLLRIAGPFPSFEGVFIAYFTIYAPILFIGVYFFLLEKKEIGLVKFIFFTSILLYQYYELIARYWPTWLESHFLIISLSIFTVAWLSRAHLNSNAFVRLLSDLTFSVYLLHNWAWEPIRMLLQKYSISLFLPDLQVLFALLFLCYVVHQTVELGGIKLGRKLLNRISQWQQLRVIKLAIP